MEKRQQLEAIDKMLREFEDIKNTQTSLLKKLSQIEADNINVGIDFLNNDLGDLHEHADTSVNQVTQLTEKLETYREDFSKKYKLEEVEEV